MSRGQARPRRALRGGQGDWASSRALTERAPLSVQVVRSLRFTHARTLSLRAGSATQGWTQTLRSHHFLPVPNILWGSLTQPSSSLAGAPAPRGLSCLLHPRGWPWPGASSQRTVRSHLLEGPQVPCRGGAGAAPLPGLTPGAGCYPLLGAPPCFSSWPAPFRCPSCRKLSPHPQQQTRGLLWDHSSGLLLPRAGPWAMTAGDPPAACVSQPPVQGLARGALS